MLWQKDDMTPNESGTMGGMTPLVLPTQLPSDLEDSDEEVEWNEDSMNVGKIDGC